MNTSGGQIIWYQKCDFAAQAAYIVEDLVHITVVCTNVNVR